MTLNKILYLTEEEVKHCITIPQAVALSDKGIQADGAGQVAGNKFYMNTGEAHRRSGFYQTLRRLYGR